ncbi:DASH complex, subunit Spc34 [Coniochaeta ligniaria NRRL 30616]|uniref:DASH complex subunit SPC34 n=1 Tax=Coniochaeta ligniaria NRRL 30616 TaxID=1408157 RepID=A0A1J7IGE5_9PEZI|nr:DASH complex, subunit Spc34 [Coniochaeta ligniaria NRRL 30616]
MSLLSAHLEQISFSCQGIDTLPFPPPKIFTNALLSNHDITSLIRDTEAHERALYSVPPPPPPLVAPKKEKEAEKPSKRRQTVFNVADGAVTTGPPSTRRPRQNTAVAAVLGGDLHAQIVRRGKAEDGTKGDVDVEVLLAGAEKLCTVYPLPGASERISALRQRYAHQTNTLAYYEARVGEQSEALGRMNKDHLFDDEEEEDEEETGVHGDIWTDEELRREEEEMRELEKVKRELQERLRDLDKDLAGVLR